MDYLTFILKVLLKNSRHLWLWISNTVIIVLFFYFKKYNGVIVLNLSLINIYLSFAIKKEMTRYLLFQQIMGITNRINLTTLLFSLSLFTLTILICVSYINKYFPFIIN